MMMHLRDFRRDGKPVPSAYQQCGALRNLIHIDPSAVSDAEGGSDDEVIVSPCAKRSAASNITEDKIAETRETVRRFREHNARATPSSSSSRRLIAISSDEGQVEPPIISPEEVHFIMFGHSLDNSEDAHPDHSPLGAPLAAPVVAPLAAPLEDGHAPAHPDDLAAALALEDGHASAPLAP